MLLFADTSSCYLGICSIVASFLTIVCDTYLIRRYIRIRRYLGRVVMIDMVPYSDFIEMNLETR